MSRFEAGLMYDVGTSLGSVMLAEGWAEPVLDNAPALLLPLSDVVASAVAPDSRAARSDRNNPPNLIREHSSPYVDVRGIAADLERRRRGR